MSVDAPPTIPAASFQHRQRFYNAKKNGDESISEWYNRLLSLALPCQFGFASSVIVLDKMVFGLEDKYVDQLSKELGDLTLEESLKIAKQMEMSSYQYQFENNAFARDSNSDNSEVETGCTNTIDATCDNSPDEVVIKKEICDVDVYGCPDGSSMPSPNSRFLFIDESSAVHATAKETMPKKKSASDDDSYRDLSLLANIKTNTSLPITRRKRKIKFKLVVTSDEEGDRPKRKYKKRQLKPNPDVEVSEDGRSFKCAFCHREWRNKGNLERHILYHYNEKGFTCQYCGKQFNTNWDLTKHIRVHTGEKPYICDICSKGFTTSDKLKVHKNYHAGIKPYPCSVCGKSFGQRGHLKTHMRCHTGERPYKCQICEKAFTMANVLATHMRIHQNSR